MLDVGCGTGALLRQAAGVFPSAALTGIDPATGMVQVARRRWAQNRSATFVNAGAEHLPFVDGTFDLVMSTVSFHHWADQQLGLREIRRVLAPGGVFLLTDAFAISWLRLIFAVGRSRDRFHTPAEIEMMLRGAGLAVGGFETAFRSFRVPAVFTIWAST
jgi:ubiquinone/menaquinone biosynthesis C-methylase UbiE